MKIRRLIASFLMFFVFLAADVVVPDLAQLMGKQNKYGIVYAFSGVFVKRKFLQILIEKSPT